MRGIRARLASDEGMTIVEVLISAAILFIVLTAILGLVLQTMNTGNQAKRQAAMTNAMNSYVERVQAMPFDEVALIDDGGKLSPSETIEVDSYEVVITPQVQPGPANGLKLLVVSGSIDMPNGESAASSLDVLIRDKRALSTSGVQNLTLRWTVMPDEGEVVWGSVRSSGRPLYLNATVDASRGQPIKSIKLTADNGRVLENKINGLPALWEFDAADRVVSWTLRNFIWNTEQTGVINEATNEEGAVIADGLRTITLEVTDTSDGTSKITYSLLVDNRDPSKPGVPMLDITSTGPVAKWDESSDGTDSVASYSVTLVRQTESGTEHPPVTSSVETTRVALQPFERYLVDVTAKGVSPKERTSAPATAWIITPPQASGTQAVSGGMGVASLSVPEPHFQVAGVPTYEWYSAPSVGGPWIAAVASTREPEVSFTGKVYYRCRVTLRPGSDPGGPTKELWSNVVGPTSSTGAIDAPLEEVWVRETP